MKKIILVMFTFTLVFAVHVKEGNAETESWYTYWAIGSASHSYEEPLDSTVEFVDALPGVTRTELSIDMFGFYVPLKNERTMAGFVISGSSDTLTSSFGDLTANQYLYGGSVMHFFGREIGDGFFLRGDLGMSKIVVETSSVAEPLSEETGTGILLGAGYAIPVTEGFRIMLALTSSTNTIEGDKFQTSAFRIGGLW